MNLRGINLIVDRYLESHIGMNSVKLLQKAAYSTRTLRISERKNNEILCILLCQVVTANAAFPAL
jgi:hypothetical protein